MSNKAKRKTVHIVLQGKGGAGKSFCAILMAQFFRSEIDSKTLLLDLDPLNPSLFSMKGLKAEQMDLIDKETDDIDTTKWDEVIQKLYSTKANNIIIDTGTNSFIPFISYMKTNAVISMLDGLGIDVVFHFVIMGGQSQDDCTKLTAEFAIQILAAHEDMNPDFYDDFKPLVIWLNPIPSKLAWDNPENSFYETPEYQSMKWVVKAVINLPYYQAKNHMPLHEQIVKMLKNHQTFDEYYASCSDDINIVFKHRMNMAQKTIFNHIRLALFPQGSPLEADKQEG